MEQHVCVSTCACVCLCPQNTPTCIHVHRDKPFLMFFDLTKCVQVVTVGELISGDVSASTLFTCPTPQVKSSAVIFFCYCVYRLGKYCHNSTCMC